MYNLLIFIIAIGVHEFGHWVLFRYYGYKANIKFKWLIIEVGDNVCHKPTLKQAINIYGSPILWGLLPIVFFGSGETIVFVYLLICSADVLQVLGILSHIKNKKIKTMNDMWIHMLKEQLHKT